MCKYTKHQFIIHKYDGFADDDPIDDPKPDDKKPDDKGDDTPPKQPEDKGKDTPPEEPKLSDMSLDDLAEANPEVSKLLEDKKKRDKEITDEEEKKKKEAGEYDQLISDRDKRIEELEKKYNDTTELVGKYAETTNQLVDAHMKNIPDDKKTLIPEDFSPRQKLAYITQNAELLGLNVKQPPKDGNIPDGDEPKGTERAELIKEIQTLQDKAGDGTITEIEKEIMFEKSQKLKALDAKDK